MLVFLLFVLGSEDGHIPNFWLLLYSHDGRGVPGGRNGTPRASAINSEPRMPRGPLIANIVVPYSQHIAILYHTSEQHDLVNC